MSAELRHGYTLADIDAITRLAVRHDPSLAMDARTRYDIAYSDICLTLYEAEYPPHRGTLIRAGWQAIYREVRAAHRDRGRTGRLVSIADHPDSGMSRHWVKYWRSDGDSSVDEQVVDRIAVRQVLPSLTGAARVAVVALAATGSYQTAAAALGLSDGTFLQRMMRARRQWTAVWYGDETQHQRAACDRRARRDLADECGNGHPWRPETTGTTRRMRRGRLYETRYCMVCSRESAARGRRAA